MIKYQVRKISRIERSTKIDYNESIEIAKKFLEQYHSILKTNAVLDGKIWIVTVKTGLSNRNIRKVRIDADTGKILDYT